METQKRKRGIRNELYSRVYYYGGFIQFGTWWIHTAMCIVNTIAEDANPVVKWIMGIIIAVAIGCGVSGLVTLQNKGDDEAWNNGYCTECNEPYKFTSTVHHKNGDDEYYYTCDNCGHTIVIHGLRER